MVTWTDVAMDDEYMVAIAPQTALGTPGSSWEWIQCNLLVPEHDQTFNDGPRGSPQYGAWMPPIPGRRWHRMALKGPVPGQLGTYDFSADTPGLKGLNRFLGFLGGTAAVAYQATGVELTGSDGNTVVLKTSNAKLGCLIASRNTSGGLVTHGFGKSYTGTGPWTWTLFDDLASEVTDDAGRLATLTLYPARAALTHVAFTIRQVFADASKDFRYQDFVPTGPMKLLVEDDILMWEIPGVAHAPVDVESSGGLTSLTSLLPMAAHVSGSRYVLRREVAAYSFGDSLADGTVDPQGSCGVRDVVLSIDYREPFKAKGPGVGGVCDIVQRAPLVTAEIAVPDLAENKGNGNENILVEAFEDQAGGLSLSAYHGTEAGKLLAWSIKGGHIAEPPRLVHIDGVRHYVGTIRAGENLLDAATTDAGRKPFTIAVG